MPEPLIEILTPQWEAHALLDSGYGRKLERFGEVVLDRPEPKAWWTPRRPENEWQRAQGSFDDENGHGWRFADSAPRSWTMAFGELTFEVRASGNSKHVGIFPEQAAHWRWMGPRLAKGTKLLNLFGYTGAASLTAAAAGAQVTHVDASKPALAWGRDHQRRSGLEDRPIRWLLDDVGKFVAREIRRKSRYDAILLDPPSFGRGPRGEVWKVERSLRELLGGIRELLSARPAFVLATLYNIEASALMLAALFEEFFGDRGGRHSCGELCLPEVLGARLLPLSLFARWEASP